MQGKIWQLFKSMKFRLFTFESKLKFLLLNPNFNFYKSRSCMVWDNSIIKFDKFTFFCAKEIMWFHFKQLFHLRFTRFFVHTCSAKKRLNSKHIILFKKSANMSNVSVNEKLSPPKVTRFLKGVCLTRALCSAVNIQLKTENYYGE